MPEPLPRSITTRRQLATQLVRRLRDYRQAAGAEASDPRALNTVVDAAALARLEGYDPDTIARAVTRGLSGQLEAPAARTGQATTHYPEREEGA